MKRLLFGMLPVIMISCSPSRISTVWKADQVYHTAFKQVLVVAVLPVNDSLDRKNIESGLATDLSSLGYPAVTAVDYFGKNGLGSMDQENTYIKLCSSGIDYVMTIALVQKPIDHIDRSGVSLLYTGSYYYNRIWEYKNRVVNTLDHSQQYFYESILFDLAELKAIAVLRTRSFYPSQNIQLINNVTQRLINKMLTEKILIKQAKPVQPKAF